MIKTISDEYVYKKEVDWSLFNYGFAIPIEHQVTWVGLLIKNIIFSVIGKEESSLMILIPECSARQMKLIFPI